MKGATLKQISNKQLNLIWREIAKELAKRFPEFVYSITIVNTPMFFENFYNNEVQTHFSERTRAKVLITGESSP
jgi:CRAL/TRIO domain